MSSLSGKRRSKSLIEGGNSLDQKLSIPFHPWIAVVRTRYTCFLSVRSRDNSRWRGLPSRWSQMCNQEEARRHDIGMSCRRDGSLPCLEVSVKFHSKIARLGRASSPFCKYWP